MTHHSYIPQPFIDERPTEYADRVGRWYGESATDVHKKKYGQYLTPVAVADFMAGLVVFNGDDIRIIDPGAGTGVLACALCEKLSNQQKKPRNIVLVAYEMDHALIPATRGCLDYLKKWLEDRIITFTFTIEAKDFIQANARALDDLQTTFAHIISLEEPFDVAISNPPYFKIPKDDPRARNAASVVHGQPNIYALFMAVSAALLKAGGELVFITPRSYTAGPYFRLFREKFFALVRPEVFHLFGSRIETFSRDEILQENLIIKARRRRQKQKEKDAAHVIISSSRGTGDLTDTIKRVVQLDNVLLPQCKNHIVHIPVSDEDERIAELVASWKGSLHNYGMEISTGPVVPFRSVSFLAEKGTGMETYAPLLWMQNVKPMSAQWPVETRKQQYIMVTADSLPLLVPDRNYVLMRRFSAKEERRRLVAAPLLAGTLGAPLLGLENHLNYIYRPKGELTPEETYGFAAFYNCRITDTYFRTFNGNTQISATELRNMPIPPIEIIREAGRAIMKNHLSSENAEDLMVSLLEPHQEFVMKGVVNG